MPFTVLLAGLWLAFDLSFAILPAVTIAIWISLSADRDLSLVAQERVGAALLAVGVLFLAALIVGVAVFVTR